MGTARVREVIRIAHPAILQLEAEVGKPVQHWNDHVAHDTTEVLDAFRHAEKRAREAEEAGA